MYAWLWYISELSNEPVSWYIDNLKQIYVVMDLWSKKNRPMNRPQTLFWGSECS